VSKNPYFCAVVLAAACCSCATPSRDRIPLAGPQRAYISDRARPAERLKIGLEVSSEGELAFENVRTIPLGLAGDFSLHAPDPKIPGLANATANLAGHTLSALIDTGSPYSLVGFDTAQRLGLVPLQYQVPGPGHETRHALLEHTSPSPSGPVHKFVGLASNVGLGDIRIYNVPLGIIDEARGLDSLWWLDRGLAETLLGYDLFSAFDYVTFDFTTRRVSVGAGRYHPEPSRLAAAVPLVKHTRVPMVEAHVEGKGPYRFALSTGGAFGLWLPLHMAEEMDIAEAVNYVPPLHPPRRVLPPATISAAARSLNVSGFGIPSVPTTISVLDAGDESTSYGLLGNLVLRDYVTTIDSKAGKVYFERP
jgi:hypothetical protein